RDEDRDGNSESFAMDRRYYQLAFKRSKRCEWHNLDANVRSACRSSSGDRNTHGRRTYYAYSSFRKRRSARHESNRRDEIFSGLSSERNHALACWLRSLDNSRNYLSLGAWQGL